MERRRALALAGSLAICVTLGGTAMAANVGLMQSTGAPGEVGHLTVQKVAAVAPPRPLPPDRPAAPIAETEATADPGPQPESLSAVAAGPETPAEAPEAPAPSPAAAPADVGPEVPEQVWSPDPAPAARPPVTASPSVTTPAVTTPRAEVEHPTTSVTTVPRSTTSEPPEPEEQDD